MEQSWKTLFLLTLPLTMCCTFGLMTTVRAQQVSPDGTLSTTVTSPDNLNFTINNGNRVGGNLFHSFREFSVPNGGSAVFQNALDVQNIINRVTGGSLSQINGLIQTQGSANLFLLNPAGIFFGQNARLNIGGSFFATTADSFLFDNGFEFSATNAIAPPLLTVNIPVGLRFRDNPGNITNQSVVQQRPNFTVGLQVNPGKTLALVGGDVSLDRGRLTALGGKVELGGLKAAGTVGINNDGSLSFPESVQRGDVLLTNGSLVDLRGAGGGTIAVNARNLELSGGSILATGIRQGFGSVGSQAGNIEIDATGTVKISDGSLIFNSLPSRTTGNSGEINIKAESVFLDNAALQASNPGQGNAGNITVQAKDTISLANFSFILSNVGNGQGVAARGDVGNILLDARVVSLTDTSQIQAGFFANAQGNPGSVSIQARESVSFTGQNSGIFANVNRDGLGDGSDVKILAESFSLKDGAVLTTDNAGRGNGGDIAINVGSLSVTNGSLITSSTSGEGDAGNLFIKASNLVEVLGTEEPGKSSDISADVSPGGTGNAGDLTIETKKLVIRSSQVGSTTFGEGNAGNVRVIATESVELSGKVFSIGESGQIIRNPAGLFAQVNIQGEGKGGNLTIDTPRLSVGDGAKVQVATFGQGDAGNLLIRASDIDVYETANADFFAGGIFAGLQVDEDEQMVLPGGGNGGTLTIETDRLRVRDGGTVSAFTEGEGNAGTLRIIAKDSVEVYGTSPNGKFTSEITAGATAQSTGSGGSLSIDTDKLIVRDRGRVTVSSENTKPAGNLEITARTINLDNQGSLTATTREGDGGNISLNVRDYLFMRRNSEISTSAGASGNGGNIFINNLPNYRGFVIAVPSENNDIIANASEGRGGKITINSPRVFGLVERSRADLERLSVQDLNPRNLFTSDITAFSQQQPQLNGTVSIQAPDVDPSRGLVELPETVTDPKQKIAQNLCQQGIGNEFVVTGRGGFPTNPNQTLSSDNVRVDLLQPVANTGNSRAINPASTVTATRVPAQGWIFNDKGQVVLTAHDPTNTGSQRSFSTAACSGR